MSDDKSLIAVRDRREEIIARLSDAFARDLLDVDEFELRLGIAHRAESVAELDPLVADMEPAPSTTTTTAIAPREQPRSASLARVRERQTIVAIMGGAVRKGNWTPARRLRIWTMMGGAELDFRDAAFAPGVTEVHVYAFMGGAHIIVPPSLAVEMEGVAIMGGFDQTERAPSHDLDPERPLLRITGVVVWGGVQIETRLLGESKGEASRRRRREKKARRKVEKLRLDERDRKLLPAPHDD